MDFNSAAFLLDIDGVMLLFWTLEYRCWLEDSEVWKEFWLSANLLYGPEERSTAVWASKIGVKKTTFIFSGLIKSAKSATDATTHIMHIAVCPAGAARVGQGELLDKPAQR